MVTWYAVHHLLNTWIILSGSQSLPLGITIYRIKIRHQPFFVPLPHSPKSRSSMTRPSDTFTAPLAPPCARPHTKSKRACHQEPSLVEEAGSFLHLDPCNNTSSTGFVNPLTPESSDVAITFRASRSKEHRNRWESEPSNRLPRRLPVFDFVAFVQLSPCCGPSQRDLHPRTTG